MNERRSAEKFYDKNSREKLSVDALLTYDARVNR